MTKDGCGLCYRSLERQPVLGVFGGTPDLLSAFDGLAATVSRILDARPITGSDEAIHETDKSVEVARFDQSGQRVVLHTGDVRPSARDGCHVSMSARDEAWWRSSHPNLKVPF